MNNEQIIKLIKNLQIMASTNVNDCGSDYNKTCDESCYLARFCEANFLINELIKKIKGEQK